MLGLGGRAEDVCGNVCVSQTPHTRPTALFDDRCVVAFLSFDAAVGEG